ncbi:hypothetical protein BDCR2A_01547 [Borrelia duttonii CR2A]|uniref:Uncharacterized protein n=1 Tax=Borrelia duttonii CR2A TaxID=1432657 RepID=W6TGG9_9SPIR|nr:hypothetical protein BDCR2A_01547 [Borrelia duttonii CR2A]
MLNPATDADAAGAARTTANSGAFVLFGNSANAGAIADNNVGKAAKDVHLKLLAQ